MSTHFTDFTELDHRAIAAAIAIPAHVVQAKGNGHGGTAMALAPLAHVLYQRILSHDPADPQWPGRDRLVLSAGHASLLLYVQLYLTGYGLELDDLAASRRLHARTPGHPEIDRTPGIEMSTGPLGQGMAGAVGMAIAARREQALFGSDRPDLFDHTIYAIVGDGCLQEGISHEAASLAGTLALDNLVVIWDDNRITIDGPTSDAFAEDVRARFAAYGWRVIDVYDGSDPEALEQALVQARDRGHGPAFVAVRTVIGAPSESHGGTPAAHAGGFGDDEVARVKERLGFAADASLTQLVPPAVLDHTRGAVARGKQLHAAWDENMAAWRSAHPDAATRLAAFRQCDTTPASAALDTLPRYEPGASVPTRSANGAVITALSAVENTRFWGGSADLSSSTNVAVPGEQFTNTNAGGAFIRFGVREHAMAAILSGIALHGPWRPFGSTYLAFSDYQRPALRLAALMDLPVVHVYTHDSVAVGEDGPTHQPVEQIAALRTIPGLDVVRPADANEVLDVWRRIMELPMGPVALVLSRQNLPVLDRPSDGDARRGGYVAASFGTGDDLALIASGSEVSLAMEAARKLSDTDGVGVRVVSMPCVEWFTAEPAAYQESVLPRSLTARVAIEAGRCDAWYRFADAVVGIEEFGESGSGPEV
ncbi:transketolase family protein, partial [Tessaracoccus sp.]